MKELKLLICSFEAGQEEKCLFSGSELETELKIHFALKFCFAPRFLCDPGKLLEDAGDEWVITDLTCTNIREVDLHNGIMES